MYRNYKKKNFKRKFIFMDFFNSLSQVAKNRNNFKKWEDNQRHENAQREELAKRRNYTRRIL